jgi:LAO/AO transport system kinase
MVQTIDFSPGKIQTSSPAFSRLALSRLLTEVENDTLAGRAALSQLFPLTGRAHLVGVTGSPGAGKSSIVNKLASLYRHPNGAARSGGLAPHNVAIVAIDPSSPFTGGAVLGDRVRMRDLTGDPGVFIRSMASRGALGGLAHATSAVVQVLDAAGFDLILIETVGAGQAEVDVARLAHTTLVVEAPGMGDDIQAIKAGILEIADILVINKADRPGVDTTERALRAMLEMAHPSTQDDAFRNCDAEPTLAEWTPPVLRTIAIENVGLARLRQAIEDHRVYLLASGEWACRETARIQAEMDALLRDTLVARWRAGLPGGAYQSAMDALVDRAISPVEAVARLLKA